jgi:hypothetical protein
MYTLQSKSFKRETFLFHMCVCGLYISNTSLAAPFFFFDRVAAAMYYYVQKGQHRYRIYVITFKLSFSLTTVLR